MLSEGIFPQRLTCYTTYCTYMIAYCKPWLHHRYIYSIYLCMLVIADHTPHWMYLVGHSNGLSLVDLHMACPAPRSLFAWNLCIQIQPHDIHLVPETEWMTPARVGIASPGAARFPSHHGRLGCTLCGGTCACQMLFSLSFPNLLISFCSERQKACKSQKTQCRLHFLCRVSLAHCISCENDRDNKKQVLSCL